MPPIDAQIPLQMQQVNPMQSMGQATQTLSSLANLQNIRTQGQILSQDAQYGQQLTNERGKFSSAMQDPNAPFKNSDGSIDYDKLQQWTATNTPLVGSQYGSQIMQMAQHTNEYKKQLSGMADDDRTRINSLLHSFMGPDGQPIADAGTMVNQLGNLRRTLTGQGNGYADMVTQAITNAKDNPQVMQQLLGQLSRDTTAPSVQTGQLQNGTGMVQNGAATLPYTQTPEYGKQPGTLQGPGIPNQLGPEGRQQAVTDPFGNPTVQARDANGNIISGPAVQNPLGPKPLAPGDVQAIPGLSQERAQTNNAAQQVPTQRYNNAEILRLASNAQTGPGSTQWNALLGKLGMTNEDGNLADTASRYQLLGHYVALQAQNNASAMGVHTDAGQAMSSAATGSPEMNRKALIEATKTNDALARGVQDFNTGMEAAIQANHGDVRAKRDFQNAWSQNFDPMIYKLRNAQEAGDSQEFNRLIGTLSPAQAKEMQRKWGNLISLTNTGRTQ